MRGRMSKEEGSGGRRRWRWAGVGPILTLTSLHWQTAMWRTLTFYIFKWIPTYLQSCWIRDNLCHVSCANPIFNTYLNFTASQGLSLIDTQSSLLQWLKKSFSNSIIWSEAGCGELFCPVFLFRTWHALWSAPKKVQVFIGPGTWIQSLHWATVSASCFGKETKGKHAVKYTTRASPPESLSTKSFGKDELWRCASVNSNVKATKGGRGAHAGLSTPYLKSIRPLPYLWVPLPTTPSSALFPEY
jgi:hypothetical protein